MTEIILTMVSGFVSVLRDTLPVLLVVLVFQFFVLRQAIPNPQKIIAGFLATVFGLYAFLIGLDMGVFPIAEAMAEQFSSPTNRSWALVFAFCIGYSTTMAEPALLAITQKAEEMSSGGIDSYYLRNAVAIGVSVGLGIGVYRIYCGDPLWAYILFGYIATVILTFLAPKEIVPLAYDSGGVTTSTITVPFVTALGLGLASNLPDRNTLMDGFGLIAFASVFPVITVLSYATLATLKTKYIN
ncbi:MAG TPA: DUF1538 domain-containing protein [Nitrospinota bacterium]|nr:DUF1538 domain-containing protein [Nitrospinota bacterium]|tara:strand:- start:7962 stop:8687 length:726 start_codon:yes stop_codon:yes gene_type:complete